MQKLIKNKNIILILAAIFILINFVTRLVLFGYSIIQNYTESNLINIFQIFGLGLLNDLITYSYIIFAFLLLDILIPLRIKKFKLYQIICYLLINIYIFTLLFTAFAEFMFWEEFATRFNFIAVDYLVYTNEVIGNILESYPIGNLLTVILIITLVIFALIFNKLKVIFSLKISYKQKIKRLFIISVIFILCYIFHSLEITDLSKNRYVNELNKNGIFSLFSAFKNNSLSFDKFYKNIDEQEAFSILKKELLQKNQSVVENSKYIIEREIKTNKPQKKYNIVLITVESLSNEFIGLKYNNQDITPFLTDLKGKSLVFNNFYATGTRTVRGLEAVTLSVPPTPGSSLVRRPNNENLFSIASILKPAGYEMQFIYGGFGYFDNMNYFYSNNHFKVVDRGNFNSEEISFANVWGVADEDLLNKSIKEADRAYSNYTPFYQHIMTTSNHRPYTFPEGKIDLASGSGRLAAVKYTDYALKQYFEQVKNKDWFENTIFVVTADHCASSAGKTNIPINKYHIPLFIYAPKIIKPDIIKTISSQIDLPPTILGLLNFSYKSRFFGNDILNKENDILVLGTYQLLGYYQDNKFAILIPQDKYEIFSVNNMEISNIDHSDELILKKAISMYQTAYYMIKNNLLKENENN